MGGPTSFLRHDPPQPSNHNRLAHPFRPLGRRSIASWHLAGLGIALNRARRRADLYPRARFTRSERLRRPGAAGKTSSARQSAPRRQRAKSRISLKVGAARRTSPSGAVARTTWLKRTSRGHASSAPPRSARLSTSPVPRFRVRALVSGRNSGQRCGSS